MEAMQITKETHHKSYIISGTDIFLCFATNIDAFQNHSEILPAAGISVRRRKQS